MSFGFSVGDFLTLSNIAWNLYNSFKDASREFKDVAAQVNSLHLILQSTADHLLNQPLRCKEVAELASLKTRCQDTLSDIDCLMRRHNSLGTRKPRRWDIVKWGLKDTAQVKGQLVFQATVLTALIASLTQ
jgi:hypothetical protein